MQDFNVKGNFEDHQRMQKIIKIWDREIEQRQQEIDMIDNVVSLQNKISRQSKNSNKLKNDFLVKLNSQSNQVGYIEDFISKLLSSKTQILEEMRGLTEQMGKLNKTKDNINQSIQSIIQIQEIKNKEIKFYQKKEFMETVEDDKKNFIIKNMRTKKNIQRISLNKSIEQSNQIFREGQKIEQEVKQCISKVLRSPEVSGKQAFSQNLLNNLSNIDTNEYDKKAEIQNLANHIIKNEELEKKTINLEKYRNQLFFQETELLKERRANQVKKSNFARSRTVTQINDTKSEGNFQKTYQFEKTVNKYNDLNTAKTLTQIDMESRSNRGQSPRYITTNSQFNRSNNIVVNSNNISNIDKTERVNKFIYEETIKSKAPDNDVISLKKNLELKETQLQIQNDLNKDLQTRLTQMMKENELQKIKKETEDQLNETRSNIQQIDFSKIQIDSNFTKKELDILKKQLDFYKKENQKLKPLKGYDELVSKLQQENESLNDKIFRKQQTIKSLQFQNNNLKNQLNENDTNKLNKDNKLSNQEKIILNLKNEVEVQKVDFNDAKQNFQEKIKELIYDNDQLEKRNRQLQAQLELLQEQFNKVKDQNINFSKNTNEKQTQYKNLLEEFEKQIAELKMLSKNQQMEIKSKDKQLHSQDDQIDQLQKQIQIINENHQVEINEYIFNYEVLNKKYTEKLSTMDRLDVLNRDQDNEMIAMKNKIAEFKSQVDTLLQEKEILIQQYEEKGHFLVQTNENLEDQLKEQQEENQKIVKEKNQKLLELNSEIQDLKQQLLDYQEQVENLNNQHEFKEVQIGQFQNENQKLNAFKEQLEEEFNGEISKRNAIILGLQNDMRELEQKFQELLKDFANIEEENQKLNFLIQDYKQQKEKMQSEKSQLELKIENLELNHKHQLLQEQFKIENLTQKYDHLKNRFKNLEVDNERQKSKDPIIETQKLEIQELKSQMQKLQAEYKTVKEELDRIEEEQSVLNDENNNMKKNYAKEVGDLQGRLQNNEIQKDTLTEENRNLLQKCEVQRKKIQELQKKIIEAQRQQNEDQLQIGNLLKEIQNYKDLDKENKKMIANLKSDNLKYNVENEQINHLHSTIQDKDFQVQKLVQNIDDLRAQIDELERQNNNLQESVERENENANVYKRKQTQAMSDIDLKQAKIKTYEEELRELQRKYDELMESYRNVLQVKDKLQQENMRMEGRIKDLDTEVSKKLSIMSKLQIKCFILSCEVERFNRNT